jgi:hypothetical protein
MIVRKRKNVLDIILFLIHIDNLILRLKKEKRKNLLRIVNTFGRIKKMGKSYMCKSEKARKSDLYETPKSLVWKLMETDEFEANYNKKVLEPACGRGVIVNELGKSYSKDQITYSDKMITSFNLRSIDFLKTEKERYNYVITNPPFSLFDDFVMKAKEMAIEKIAFIGKVNFFGAYQRYEKGVWDHLKHVYIFNRQVDYRGKIHEDGLFHVGGLVTGWFIWDMNWDRPFWKTSIMDVQEYAKLGQYKG